MVESRIGIAVLPISTVEPNRPRMGIRAVPLKDAWRDANCGSSRRIWRAFPCRCDAAAELAPEAGRSRLRSSQPGSQHCQRKIGVRPERAPSCPERARWHGQARVWPWINNRAENSHQPFRRRSGRCFASAMPSLQKNVRSPRLGSQPIRFVDLRLDQERHLSSRPTFKERRAAALNEWRQLCAA